MKKLSRVDNLQTALFIIFLVLLSFPLAQIGTINLDQIQLIGVLVLMVIVYHRFVFPRLGKINIKLATYIEISPFLLLIPLLIQTTGGFLSPLLITAHLTAISLAILINPLAALSFLLTTLSVIVMHFLLVLHPLTPVTDLTTVLGDNLSLIVISFLSFIATIPLFSLFSHHEEMQTDWLNYLDKQVTTNQAQEQALLSNLKDAILVVNPKGFIVMMNAAGEDLTGTSEVEVLGRSYFEVLKLTDDQGQKITILPVERVLKSNHSFILKNLRLETSHKGIKARVKFSPIKNHEGSILGILIVVENTTSATEIAEIQNDTLSLALFKFTSLLSDARSYNATLLDDKKVTGTEKIYVDRLMHINQDLLRLSEDFLLSVRLSQEGVGLNIAEVKITALLDRVLNSLDSLAQKEKITHTLKKDHEVTLKTDPVLLSKAFTNLLVIGTRLSKDKTTLLLDVQEVGEKLQIYFNFQIALPDLNTKNLREKFFGGSELFTTLPKATGLEVYLADNILTLLGGTLSITKNPKNSEEIEFLVELPIS